MMSDQRQFLVTVVEVNNYASASNKIDSNFFYIPLEKVDAQITDGGEGCTIKKFQFQVPT